MSENDNKEFVEAALEIAAQGGVQESEHPAGLEMEEWAFTNDKTNPAIRQLFHILHEAAFRNKLGVMHSLNKTNKTVETIIVGVEVVDGQVLTFPLAKVLTVEEQDNYHAPDGEGGYVGYSGD